jgi:hypothetical protein
LAVAVELVALAELRALSGTPSPNYVTDFLATTDGLALVKAFAQINDPSLRRSL